MITVISPAKTLDFETPPQTDQATQPAFLKDSKKLIEDLRKLSEAEIADLMSISPKLATLNAERYRDWKTPFRKSNAKQALLAFKGDVYTGFELERYDDEDFAFAQDHLRILSGLYGLLRPLDLIQPYRLEMGTKFANARGKDLYAFWQKTVTHALQEALASSGNAVLLNLASNEYFGAVHTNTLDAEIVTPVFHDEKDGQYKVISFFAKKARGAMSDFVIRERVNEPEGLKKFRGLGYRWSKQDSRGNTWVFTRAEKDRPA